MIYKIISASDMHADERLSDFTYDAIEAIYDDLLESIDDVEYDPVSLRCNYTECDAKELREMYGYLDKFAEAETDEELEDALQYYTSGRQLKNGMFLFIHF